MATVILTREQHMAILDILVAYARTEEPQVFVSVLNGKETTVGDLLTLFVDTATLQKSPQSLFTTCPRCQRTSYHPEDVKNKYCGACHRFYEENTDAGNDGQDFNGAKR